MKISWIANIVVPATVLLCFVTAEMHNLPVHRKPCPVQCVCSQVEMICPGANITEVLSYRIGFQVLHIDISNTTLDYFPQDVSFMTNCKKLNMSMNKIQTIDKNALVNLWNLEELVLSRNAIVNLASINPSVLFFNNKNLRKLNLSNNPLTDLGQDLDSMLYSESLEVLDVSRCHITSLVGPAVLDGLKNLTYLNLSNNPLVRLDALFSSTLSALNVRNCLLRYLSETALIGLKKLEVLDISLNEQLYLDKAIISPSLKVLDVSQCSVRAPNLNSMYELKYGFINGNRIRRLTSYQFANNSKLMTLDLSENHVESIDPLAFYGLSSLIYLDLSTNMITDVPWTSTLATLPSLDMLNMSHNFISQIGVLQSNTLRKLDLSHCWIQSIPNGALVQLDQLSEIILSNNPLQTLLPGSLNSTHLSLLDLSYCRISYLISYEFINSPNLTEIRLTGNRLVTLKNGTFTKCPKLKYVYLDDNPWRCDCYSVDFSYMAKLANITTKYSSIDRDPRCSSPDNVTGVQWHVACANLSAYGRDNRKNFSMAVGVILILCVSGLMAIFVAVHENIKSRQALRRRRQSDDYGASVRGAGHDEYFDVYAATAESVRKMSQLPSYAEAIMLPKPPESHRTKRHSCTQTDCADLSADRPPPQLVHIDRYCRADGKTDVARRVRDRMPTPPPPLSPRLHVTQL